MKHYAILPDCMMDTPQELIDACGSLYPFITTLSGARRYAKNVKKRFPKYSLELIEGETWGDAKVIEVF